MAAPQTPEAPPARRGLIAGRPTWQLALGAGVIAGIGFYLYRVHQANKAAPAPTSTEAPPASGVTGDSTTLQPIVEQSMPGPAGPRGATGPRGPAGGEDKDADDQPVGSRQSASDFPQQIPAYSTTGKTLVSFATITNHRIAGKNVGASGAPVYALVNTRYGPIWQQGFNPTKLPNGTKIGTLPQFKKDIRG